MSYPGSIFKRMLFIWLGSQTQTHVIPCLTSYSTKETETVPYRVFRYTSISWFFRGPDFLKFHPQGFCIDRPRHPFGAQIKVKFIIILSRIAMSCIYEALAFLIHSNLSFSSQFLHNSNYSSQISSSPFTVLISPDRQRIA